MVLSYYVNMYKKINRNLKEAPLVSFIFLNPGKQAIN